MSEKYIDPNRQHFAAFKNLPRDQPVEMLNLVCLNEVAEYEDGTKVPGKDAYAAYGRESGPIFRKVGGSIVWSGEPRFIVIGPADEHWDIAFIAHYPSAQAFLDMVYDPEYQAVVHHRQAAVKTSRLIRMLPKAPGEGFGE